MRNIAVVTVGRSDYGIYLPLLCAIHADPELQLTLIVAGAHLSPEYGLTVDAIETDGFEISARVEMLLSSDTPEGIAKSMGLGTIGFAQAYANARPDILVVLGDRFEMHAAALAALPFKIPLAHIHGGEITEGAIDDALRHAMTKLSHLHFVSTEVYAQRVRQLGEEPWRVFVSGAPGLDNLKNTPLLTRDEIASKFNLQLSDRPLLLVTLHPATLESDQIEYQVAELSAALALSDCQIVFTMPNADSGGRAIAGMIAEYVAAHTFAQNVDNLGTQGYFSMMSIAAAMVGNSSSGMIEAASFELPVVNLGSRQAGRVRGANIIDVDYACGHVLGGIRKALDPQFRSSLRGMQNPYNAGDATKKIISVLKQIALDEKLIVKHFYDLNQ